MRQLMITHKSPFSTLKIDLNCVYMYIIPNEPLYFSSGLSALATQLVATLATPVAGPNDSLLNRASVSTSLMLLESGYQFDEVSKLTPLLQEYTEFVRIETCSRLYSRKPPCLLVCPTVIRNWSR